MLKKKNNNDNIKIYIIKRSLNDSLCQLLHLWSKSHCETCCCSFSRNMSKIWRADKTANHLHVQTLPRIWRYDPECSKTDWNLESYCSVFGHMWADFSQHACGHCVLGTKCQWLCLNVFWVIQMLAVWQVSVFEILPHMLLVDCCHFWGRTLCHYELSLHVMVSVMIAMLICSIKIYKDIQGCYIV